MAAFFVAQIFLSFGTYKQELLADLFAVMQLAKDEGSTQALKAIRLLTTKLKRTIQQSSPSEDLSFESDGRIRFAELVAQALGKGKELKPYSVVGGMFLIPTVLPFLCYPIILAGAQAPPPYVAKLVIASLPLFAAITLTRYWQYDFATKRCMEIVAFRTITVEEWNDPEHRSLYEYETSLLCRETAGAK